MSVVMYSFYTRLIYESGEVYYYTADGNGIVSSS